MHMWKLCVARQPDQPQDLTRLDLVAGPYLDTAPQEVAVLGLPGTTVTQHHRIARLLPTHCIASDIPHADIRHLVPDCPDPTGRCRDNGDATMHDGKTGNPDVRAVMAVVSQVPTTVVSEPVPGIMIKKILHVAYGSDVAVYRQLEAEQAIRRCAPHLDDL
jgi:hypothetical protein